MITRPIEVKQRVLNKRSDIWPAQPAFTAAGIQLLIDRQNAAIAKMLRLDHCTRQAVGQAKRDELNGLGRIEVR